MNRDAKRINPSLRPEIDRVKSYIRNNNGGGFDGDGYIFKQAVSEMKKELKPYGKSISYDRKRCLYFVIKS